MSNGTPVVSILIVNWNTADLLLRCLASVAETVEVEHEVIVVDNASSDDSVRRVRERFPEVRLISSSQNVGFARANNIALEAATGSHLFLLNPDTAVRAGAIESVIDHLETHARAGIAGPSLWNPDGSTQASVQRKPTLVTEFLRQTMLHRLLPGSGVVPPGGSTRRVEVVTGAALCIRRDCYEQVGPLDDSIFMFYEDVDWCCRAVAAGWEVWFVACAGILHEKSAASSRGEARTRTILDSLRSAILFFRKYRGGGSLNALRGIALLGSAVRSLRATLLWMLGRNRSEQRARLRAYGRIMRWALTGGDL